MRKTLLIGLILSVFLTTSCATDHIAGRTFGGMLIGGGAGYFLCGPKCAYAGAAILGGVGHMVGTQEEMAGKTLRPVKKVVVRGKAAEKLGVTQLGEVGEDENYCEKKYYYSPRLQTECKRGLRKAKREIERIREREAYEDGRRGY